MRLEADGLLDWWICGLMDSWGGGGRSDGVMEWCGLVDWWIDGLMGRRRNGVVEMISYFCVFVLTMYGAKKRVR